MAIKKSNTNARVKKKSKAKSIKNKKALIVAQEIKFTRLLASSDKKVTDKVLKSLQKWLTARDQSNYAFTEVDFLRLWKGLFYCMWMSDKPLVQEETAEVISKLVHCFQSKDTVLLYTKSTLKSLSSQWFGMDKYRVDKFEMLLRRIIRQTFLVFKNNSWDLEFVKNFAKNLEEFLLDRSTSLGIILHIVEVYMEELAKTSEGNISEEVVTELLRPFILYMISNSDDREIKPVVKNIFRYLIFQSDVGLEYQDKFNAWKAAGFPCGSIKDVKKIELSDEESLDSNDEENTCEDDICQQASNSKITPMDPRAGKVDVELPQIPFDAKQIVDVLTEYKFHKLSTTKSRKYVTQLINEFKALSQGDMPLGIKEVTVPKKRKNNAFSKRATARLLQFESELCSDTIKNKKRKRKLPDLDESIDTQLQSEDKLAKRLKKRKKQKVKNTDDNTNEEETPKSLTKIKLTEANNQDPSLVNVSLKKKRKDKIKNKNFSNCSLLSMDDKEKECLDNKKQNNDKCITKSRGWDVSEVKPPLSPQKMKSLTPVIEKLDISHTDFIKETLKRSKLVEYVKVSSPKSTNSESPVKSKFKKPCNTPTTKVLNPMAIKAKSEPKKRVKIMLHHNTAQHRSEYLRQLKQSPAIPYDANRKPLTSVLKTSPFPSPTNPFYKRRSF